MQIDNIQKILRPKTLKDYVGQSKNINVLKIHLSAAKMRNQTLGHTLFYGSAGLGKTTLSNIIANELEKNIKIISAPSIEKIGDLISLLTSLETGDCLFIDEIHRLPKNLEEYLYSAMEEFKIDYNLIRDDENVKIRLDLNPFTLIGATTLYGLLSSPLRTRFQITIKLDYYTLDEIIKIIRKNANNLNYQIDYNCALEIAKRSRFTPRIANNLLLSVRDFADVKNEGIIDLNIIKETFNSLSLDENGLNYSDYNYLKILVNNNDSKSLGIDSIALLLNETKETIQAVYEPFLHKMGYLEFTKAGRKATQKAIDLINKI